MMSNKITLNLSKWFGFSLSSGNKVDLLLLLFIPASRLVKNISDPSQKH